jgi:cytochrome c oxidase subunit 2
MSTLLLASEGTFWLPVAASTFAASHDGLFYFIYWLCVVFFIGIIGTMMYFVWKYRQRSPDDVTSPLRGDHRIEILWSAGPSVLLVAIFAWGFVGFMDMMVPPPNAMQVNVTGQKWSWAFEYPSGGTSTELVVPVGEPVRLRMHSVDVLHSFYVPAFRVKRDVLPGRYTVLWFQSDVPGEYPIYCTEYCGTDHSRMVSTVRVVPQAEYDEYVATLGGCPDGETLEACGEAVYRRFNCVSCHSVDGSRGVGPTFQGLAGSQVPLADGTQVLGDETYLRTAILNPMAQIHEGYPPVMPGSYAQQLSEEQVSALIAFIQSHGSN